MTLTIDLKPVESLLFRGTIVAMGTFRCPASHPLFRDSGPCSHHTVVFPRTSTVIRHSGGDPFTATPNCATLYNEKQEYTRSPVSNADESDWFVFAEDVLAEIVHHDGSRPFREACVSVDARTYLRQRRLFDSAKTEDILAVEEEAIGILARTLQPEQTLKVSRGMSEAIEATKRKIGASPSRRFSLRDLAAAVDCSPFHLCRAFRQAVGVSITSFQNGLRLRLSREILRKPNAELSDIALQLGFASHSHFSARFREYFGMTPSKFRTSPNGLDVRMITT